MSFLCSEVGKEVVDVEVDLRQDSASRNGNAKRLGIAVQFAEDWEA